MDQNDINAKRSREIAETTLRRRQYREAVERDAVRDAEITRLKSDLAQAQKRAETDKAEYNDLIDRAVKAEHFLEVAYDAMDGFCQDHCDLKDKCKGCPIGDHEKELAELEGDHDPR